MQNVIVKSALSVVLSPYWQFALRTIEVKYCSVVLSLLLTLTSCVLVAVLTCK